MSIDVYGEGLVYCSVCSDLLQEDVEKYMANRLCGTTKGWTLVQQGFLDGSPQGISCHDKPTHRHWVFEA